MPFVSPASLEVELQLPNRGLVKGMAITPGVTLIVGGGFHGMMAYTALLTFVFVLSAAQPLNREH